MPPGNDGRIYSATYSNVPVYEFNCDGNHVMRRRSDDWINATHILKVAGLDKPARTRVLEREVQKGVHEKVQGGYGKYQGTWVPLHDGRHLAERNGVLAKMLPIFDFVPGDRSPPPAPKHMTAPVQKPRAPRQSNQNHRFAGEAPAQARSYRARPGAHGRKAASQISEEQYEDASIIQDIETPENMSVISDSVAEEDMLPPSQFSTGSRKRKRANEASMQDQEHQMWADSLLDYFMLLESEDRFPAPPEPPPGINLDRAIDEKGHSALHWAAAMGDIEVVKDLIRRGASIDCLSNNRETPLMRVVMFTNNFDKNIMPKMARILIPTVALSDWFGSTVFHHIAATTSSRNKYLSARYYLDSIINILSESFAPDDITKLLNRQDQNGDTAIMIAARNGARKCVRSLLGRNVAVDMANHMGETADDLIRDLNRRRQARGQRQASSSPFAPEPPRINGDGPSPFFSSAPTQRYRSQTANTLMGTIATSFTEQCEQLASAYEAELEEKDQDIMDAERLLRKRHAEVEEIQRQIAELEAQDQGDEMDEIQDEELAALIRESEALLELEQRFEMQQLISREEAKIQQQGGTKLADGGGPGDLQEKLKLATALYRAQADRKALVQEIVQAQSIAGMGERQAEYKRLITGALGVREEDVEGMLPDILAELEEAKERDRLEASSA
ncbi:apses-domain-containing protein [Rhizodiscina lignyota]|uniref:Apses-domain-containing protein n=1 Tax=Rhizodiscina lignyota TaxID=1504668 RepID=A0A9P4IJH5_9PEZI|nr:apses-domain-containing protein [Rhizodiscina lignyota]